MADTKWDHFDALRNHEQGRLWTKLNNIEPRNVELDLMDFSSGAPVSTDPIPRQLFHYTDIQGLKGILESNSLWASAAYYLNDLSEIEYGCSLLLGELSSWIEPNKDSKRIAAQVLKHLCDVFKHPGSKLSRSLNIYVTCFCEKDNLLSQWRAYGLKGGYALGFRQRMDLILKVAGPFNVKLAKVVYDKNKQLERVRGVLREVIVAVDAEFGDTPVTANNLETDIVVLLQELLLDEIVRFKHPSFEDEREWRLVARFDFRHAHEGNFSPEPFFKFRNTGGHLVPYIELRPKAGKLPLTSIRFGPSLDFRRYEDPMRLYLANTGFTGIGVGGSDLPVIL